MEVKGKLEVIKIASQDVKVRIDEVLKKDDKIELATLNADPYAEDLYRLMKQMAEAANPVLKKLGLDKEAVTHDIEEFVKILEDNKQDMYFASVNIDAKYTNNKYRLINLSNWFQRLVTSIEKIEGYLETESEAGELKQLFSKLDRTELPKAKKEELKEEFLRVLNKLNR